MVQTEMLLLGNLLSFYEQLRIFQERASELRPYNLEKPLWVFVGSTVNAVYSENREKRSDVLTVARFLHHVLENKGDWVGQGIQKLLEGKSGLATPDGTDIFPGVYVLRKPVFLHRNCMRIFWCGFSMLRSSGLHLCGIRSSAGELGLKAGGADDYFGLIYIGDTNEFKKLVESDRAGIVLRKMLFPILCSMILIRDSKINILIGAKNSWKAGTRGASQYGFT